VVVVAEGVETADQLRVLRQLGCGMGQGFLFGRPSSAEMIGPRLATAGAGSPMAASQLAAV